MSNIKLKKLAESLYFQSRVESALASVLASPRNITEDDGEEKLSPEEEKAMEKIVTTFADQFKKSAGEIKHDAADEKEIEQIKKKYPQLKKLGENQVNEAVGAALISGLIVAIPKLIELFGLFTKGAGTLLAKFGFKKGEQKLKNFAEKIIHAGHDLHKKYIKVVQGALKVMLPEFNTLPADAQAKVAEIIYMVIVVSLGVSSGLGAVDAFKASHFSIAGVEGLLAAVKSGEIATWLTSNLPKVIPAA